MTVLVTGGAGFIGSALVRALVADGEAVVTVDKLTYAGNLANLASCGDAANHVFIRADICDRAAMRAVFAEHRPRAVFHLAAESHVDRAIDMTFCGEMKHGARAMLREDGAHGGAIADIGTDEDMIGGVAAARQIGEVAGIGQLVHRDDRLAIGDERTDERGADEAGAAADEDRHADALRAHSAARRGVSCRSSGFSRKRRRTR